MNLKHLTDQVLHQDAKFLVQQERHLITKILWHLKEIDRRRLYCDLKYPSLFEYCVKELGYSEGAAQRRIVAARALEKMPELEEKIETGKLTLTTIGLVMTEFKDPIQQKEVLQKAESKTKAQTQDLIAEIKNKPRTHWLELDDETYKLLQQLKGLRPGKEVLKEALQTAITAAAAVKTKHPDRHKGCANCGGQHNLEVDHIKPRSMGGSNQPQNLRILCRPCNQRAAIRQGVIQPSRSHQAKSFTSSWPSSPQISSSLLAERLRSGSCHRRATLAPPP